MKSCLYCIDNDILKKLATFGLFDETLALFEANHDEINILTTAKYKFRREWEKAKRGRFRSSESQFVNYERTIELAETLPQIADSAIDLAVFNQLSAFENIDQGEAVLTAHVAQFIAKDKSCDAFILTGDKRYLRALASVGLPIVQPLFSHRFWCLEQLILWNINAYGFEFVREKVVPGKECDKALKAVFGSGDYSTSVNAMAALRSYVEALRQETGNLLHLYPGSEV